MDNRKLQRLVVDALEDVKAQDIEIYNTTGISDLFDRVVLASGTSNRQTRALAANVAEKVKHGGGTVISVEGLETGEWVLVDLGDIVVHIMQPAIRAYYSLEEIWGGRPVNVKLQADPIKPRAKARKAPAAKTATPARKSTAAKSVPSSRKSAPAKRRVKAAPER